jgi:DNA-binding NtrC family response regulator
VKSLAPVILVVDSEEIIRKSCANILSAEGCSVETAVDAWDGLNKMRARKNNFEIVITETSLQDITGIKFLRKIKSEYPDTDVITLSRYGSAKTLGDAIKNGAYACIEKPFVPETLLNCVIRCLERRKLMSENMRLKYKIRNIHIPEDSVEMPATLVELNKIKKALRKKSVETIEKIFVTAALDKNGWNITRASGAVGMQRTNFHALMRKYDVSKKNKNRQTH